MMEEAKRRSRKENRIMLGLFGIITLGFYLYLFHAFTPIFGINDDWTVYMVLSGSYLGEPDAQVLFFLYPLAWIISSLYKLTTAIPWYGLCLHGCFLISGFWLFWRCWRFKGLAGKRKKALFAALALLLFWFSCLGVLTMIQYTHSAAVCGASAIFCFFTADTKGRDWKGFLKANIPTLLMAGLALCIRQNAAFMCLPAAGMLFAAKFFLEEKKLAWEGMKKYLGFAGTLLIMTGALLISHQAAYSSAEWSEYARINYYREKVVDFYGTLEYAEMKDVAEKTGMSEKQYKISQEILNFYTGDLPYSEFLEIMMERSKERYDEANPLSERFKTSTRTIVRSFVDSSLLPQNRVVLLLGVFLLAGCIWGKEWKGIFTLLAWQLGRLFAWYYILFNGRFPLRIPQCLFFIDILVLMAIGLYFGQSILALGKEKKGIFQAAAVSFLGMAFLIGAQGIKRIQQDTAHVESYQDRWYGVKEYCMENPDKMYLLNGGSQTLFYFSDSVLDTHTIGKPQNYYANSNFYSLSPNFYKKTGIEPGSDVAEAILEQENNYWIYETGCFSEELSIVNYYKDRYHSFTWELVDTFSTKTSSFEVYRFSK